MDEQILTALTEELPCLTNLTHLDLFHSADWLQLQLLGTAQLDKHARKTALQITYAEEIRGEMEDEEIEALLELTAKLAEGKKLVLQGMPAHYECT